MLMVSLIKPYYAEFKSAEIRGGLLFRTETLCNADTGWQSKQIPKQRSEQQISTQS